MSANLWAYIWAHPEEAWPLVLLLIFFAPPALSWYRDRMRRTVRGWMDEE